MKKSSFYAVLMVTIGLFIATVAVSENTPSVTSEDQNGSIIQFDPQLLLTSVADACTVYVPE